MGRMKIACGWSAALCLLGGLQSCASPASGPTIPQNPGESQQAGPKTGMTFASVQAELTKLLAGRKSTIRLRLEDSPGSSTTFSIDSIAVKQDRLEMFISKRGTWILPYEALVGEEFSVKNERGSPDLSIIKISGVRWSFVAVDPGSAKQFTEDLGFLQKGASPEGPGNPALTITPEFEALAAKYRALAVKPPITEEQRRYLVQADALRQVKDYAGALDTYGKALVVDPVAYPAAYFNMALLAVEKGRYHAAIALMKKYLLLLPDAQDARAAQDKIYEWEVLMQKG